MCSTDYPKQGLILYTELTQLRVKATSSTHTHTRIFVSSYLGIICVKKPNSSRRRSVCGADDPPFPEGERTQTSCGFVQAGWLCSCNSWINILPERGARLLYLLLAVISDAGGAICVQSGWKGRVWSRFNLDCACIVSTQQQDSL